MIPLPPAPPGAFCAPAGRRDPGRSPAALRAASADFRPLRRASRPSGLRPASPPPPASRRPGPAGRAALRAALGGASGAPRPGSAGAALRALPLHHPLSNSSPHKKILRRITTIRRRNYFLFGYGIPAKILSNGP